MIREVSGPPMCDQTPPNSRDDTPVAEPRRVTVDDLRRAVDSVRDLSDPALMAKAWDEPTTRDVQPATNSPRRFAQLDNLSVPDDFDVPLPDTEIIAGEGYLDALQGRGTGELLQLYSFHCQITFIWSRNMAA
jgi:hypothetical protein